MSSSFPKDWSISTIEDTVEILDNQRKPVNATERAKRIGNIPYYGATGLAGYIDDFIFDDELILLGEDGAPFFDKSKDVAFKINGKTWVNNHAHVLKAKKITTNNFLLYYLNQFDYNGFVGGTTRLKLTQTDLKRIPFPLPPLLEQKRIVAKLDALFAQHEAMKKALERIPQSLKDFRQQVLMQAVTGKLTKKWREENELEEWKFKKLGDICNLKAGKFVPASEIKNETEEGYFPCYGGNGLRGFVNSYTHIGKYSLIGRQGALCGNVHLIEGQFHATEHALVVTPVLNIDETWLFHKLTSLELINYSKGVAQPGLSVMNLNPIMINIPPFEEQQEIVNRIESLFSKANTIEKRYKTLKEKIDSLPQAILHKAFKGELVPQLPTDGDAKDLLKEILELKKEVKKK